MHKQTTPKIKHITYVVNQLLLFGAHIRNQRGTSLFNHCCSGKAHLGRHMHE